jgi:hypothetical protein
MSKNKKRTRESTPALPAADAENETWGTVRSSPQWLPNYVRTRMWVSVPVLILAVLTFAGGLKYLEEDAQRETAVNG